MRPSLLALAPGAFFFFNSASAAPTAVLPFSNSSISANNTTQTLPDAPQTSQTQSKNCNTPSNRACWLPGFDINTDWEVDSPTTGVVRSVSNSSYQVNLTSTDRQYTFEITEVDDYLGPDGVIKKKAMLINSM